MNRPGEELYGLENWDTRAVGRKLYATRYKGEGRCVQIPGFYGLDENAFAGKDMAEVVFLDMMRTRLDDPKPMPGLENVKHVKCMFSIPISNFLHLRSLLVRMPAVEEIEILCPTEHQLILWEGIPQLDHIVHIRDSNCHRLTIYGTEDQGLHTDNLRFDMPLLTLAKTEGANLRAVLLYSCLKEPENFAQMAENHDKSLKRNGPRWLCDFVDLHFPDTILTELLHAIPPMKPEQYDKLISHANDANATAFAATVIEEKEKHVDREEEEAKQEKQFNYDMEHPFSARNMKVDWDWKQLGKKEVVLTRCRIKDAEEIFVPPEIAGKTVTALGDGLFRKNKAAHIFLPDTIRTIGQECFMLSGIEELELPEGIEQIGDKAFSLCSKLKSFVFPEHMERIPALLFARSGISNVTLHDHLKCVGEGAFFECAQLQRLELPDSVESIEQAAFARSGLEQISLPASVNQMGIDIWNGCMHLMEVVWPETQKVIPVRAFSLSAVRRVSLPDALTEIGPGAFKSCKDLDTVGVGAVETLAPGLHFPENIREICDEAFAECVNIRQIDLSWKREPILLGDACFSATGVEKAVLPKGYCIIPKRTFDNCTELREVEFSRDVQEIQAMAFQNTALTEVKLPPIVKMLGDGVFRNCRNLKHVHFPEGIKKIGTRCLFNSGVEEVCFPQSVKEIEIEVIGRCYALERVTMARDARRQPRWAGSLNMVRQTGMGNTIEYRRVRQDSEYNLNFELDWDEFDDDEWIGDI
ncbi:MAG: leucine-rich repeat domain-containing protein [Clostridia bacterium]|nr:leucine-rich repeat domain-containing protein [Clostridia bacterium]